MPVQVTNVRLIDNSGQIKSMSKQAIKNALEDIGKKCTEYAKEKCPVDTGALKASLTYQVNAGEQYVDVGTPDILYGKYQELGTSRMRAQPFLRPAAEGHTSEYKSIVENAMKNG